MIHSFNPPTSPQVTLSLQSPATARQGWRRCNYRLAWTAF
ncbi:hypothetical protein E2C01_099212 [Portunus trituberculatus]|uniref:Uncharacterized protein n=1 Tax=Portunus trituberculatus TaxID=210409 RepID=A0A5B7K3A8_PORTR|nr:hypothetical protein [Portunus trituberculatus]